MNFKGISYYLSLFCFPISILAFINILYSSYFDYFLNINSYLTTLVVSFVVGSGLLFFGKKSEKRINFIEQLLLIILVYLLISFFIALPFYLSNYQVTFLNSLFEAISGITGTGFSIFKNIKYLDPTLVLWRSSSQWIGGLYFLFFFPGIIALAFYGYEYAALAWKIKETSWNSPAQIQIYMAKSLIPLSGVLLTIQGISEVFRSIICIQTGHWPARMVSAEETEKILMRKSQKEDETDVI